MPTNIQNLQDIEQKTTALAQQKQPHHVQQPSREERSSHDLSENRTTTAQQSYQLDKDKNRNNEWNAGNNQQQPPPQIDTWTNDASTGNGGNPGGNYSRYNRVRSGGTTGGAKFNNYR